ncbi:DNA polymerase [uncultured Fusobacterium sp.]|uniref:DNA polymerase n=1 Tax=uncultured Fusobacterium sp. TaxID=159267 RepID=UPI0025CF2C4D|nr:DNA polymerase [uncultured Fusobacterium sp.]
MIHFCSEQKRVVGSSVWEEIEVQDIISYFKNHKFIALDTETSGLDPHSCELLSIQFGDFDHQFVIEYSPNILEKLKPLLLRKDVVWVLQNAKFDLQFFYKHDIILENIFDTYLAEGVLYCGFDDVKLPNYVRKSLDVLVLKYCGVLLNKSIRGTINRVGLTDKVIEYGANDVKYLIPVMTSQMIKIKEDGLWGAVKLDNKFVKVLAYIEYCGIYLNKEKWLAKMEDDSKKLSDMEFALNKWVFERFGDKYVNKQLDLFSAAKRCSLNWSSSKQIIPIFKELGVDTKVRDKKTGKMKDSIEAKHIVKQVHVSPLIQMCIDYKKAQKLVTTYGQNFLDAINPKTGRIHATFWQIMNTGRTSCGSGDNKDDDNSINLQNIPSDKITRGCFTNQFENTILVDCDYSQQEDRMYTQLSKEPALIDFYNDTTRKRDGHSFTAKLCFPKELKDIPEEEVKHVRPDLRSKAKGAKFAILFGGVGDTIAKNLGLSKEEGDEVYDAYMKAFPKLKEYFDYIKPIVVKNGYVYFNKVTGRRSYYQIFDEYERLSRTIDKQWWENYKQHKFHQTEDFLTYYKPTCKRFFNLRGDLERRALNFPCQGSASDMSKLAGVWFFDWILKENLFNKVKISNFVHDSL